MLRNVEGWGESNLVEYPAVEDGLKQVVCKHHIPEMTIIVILKYETLECEIMIIVRL